jgi:hypothetical protein
LDKVVFVIQGAEPPVFDDYIQEKIDEGRIDCAQQSNQHDEKQEPPHQFMHV